MRYSLSCLICFLTILFSGCQAFKSPSLQRLSELKNAIPLSTEKTESLLNSLKIRYNSFNSLSSLIKMSFQVDGSSRTTKQVFLFEKNSFLRVEILSVFGQPIIYFLSDGKIINIYNPGENTFFYGKATAKNIHKLLGISFRPYDIAELLPAIIKISKDKGYTVTEKDDNIILKISGEVETTLIVMDKKSLDFSHLIKYNNEGIKILEVAYSNYKKIDGHIFPFTVNIDIPHKKKSIRVRSKEISINKELPPEMKKLQLPDKVRIINID